MAYLLIPLDDAIVFPSARGTRLSADGVQYLLSKHVDRARQNCPSLRDKHVTPHVLRHTMAMELLQAGVGFEHFVCRIRQRCRAENERPVESGSAVGSILVGTAFHTRASARPE